MPKPGYDPSQQSAPTTETSTLVFVFGGQGVQHPRISHDLYHYYPTYRDTLDRVCAALDPHLDLPGHTTLRDILRTDPHSTLLERVEISQPAHFAAMVALAELLRTLAVTPDLVIGHSQGEIAAAHVAGALTLPDAATVIAARSRALATLAGTGAMASLLAPAGSLIPLLTRWDDRITVAAVNGTANTTVAGDPEAITELLVSCERQGIPTHRIRADYPSHSPRIATLRRRIRYELADIHPRRATIAFHSTVDGRPHHTPLDTTALTGDYWYDNLRNPVRYHDTVTALLDAGPRTFLELTPHPLLTPPTTETIIRIGLAHPASSAGASTAITALRPDRPDTAALAAAFTRLRKHRHSVPLPTYPVDHHEPPPGLDPAEHPFLSCALELTDEKGWVFTGHLAPHTHPWLSDHATDDGTLFPGTGFAELARYAAHRAGCQRIRELIVHAPLVLTGTSTPAGEVDLRVQIGEPDATAVRRITIAARPEPGIEWTIHATANTEPGHRSDRAADPGRNWPPPGARPVDIADFYRDLDARGYHFGPIFRGLHALWQPATAESGELYAEITLPEGADTAGYGIHPALLDAALQPAALLLADSDSAAPQSAPIRLPYAFTDLTLHATGATRLRTHLTRTGADTVSLYATDPTGQPVATIGALTLRAVATASATPRPQLYELAWARRGTRPSYPAADPGTGAWTVLTGHPDALLDVPPETTVVWPADLTDRPGDPATRVHTTVAQALRLLQIWTAHPATTGSHLIVLTRRAVTTAPRDPAPDPAHAAVWGLTRTAQTEHPHHRITLLDADTGADVRPAIAEIVAAASAPTARTDAQFAWRMDTLLTPGLTPTTVLDPPAGTAAWRLDTTGAGSLDNLVFRPSDITALGADQVRIAVRAAGLNFHDVVVALGAIPGTGFGGEAAGVITEIGSGVTEFAVGDAVTGLAPAAFAPTVVTDRRTVIPLPAGLSYQQAATLPIAFATAYAALIETAELRPGMRVLIHAGTGGVGQAAIQLARQVQAEVFATASPAKWPVLRALGLPADHIGSTRTLDFRDDFLRATDGQGMHAVLDCLAGEFVDASLDLLPRGGCFVEIGKTDLRDPEIVAATHPGVEYRALDLSVLAPDRIHHILASLASQFAAGVLQPLPFREYSFASARQAFADMAAARHTGKIVLSPPRRPDPAGTVLITGGTGTLGGLLAEHLATEYGIRHLLLVSRRATTAPGATELRDRLTALGAEVTLAACDTTSRADLAALLDAIPAEHPLTAVVHTAVVLADAPVTTLTPGQLDRVLTAKFDSAWHLHELTRHLDLTAFVLYSSMAGVLGAAGQANYAAANTALDALAEYRHHRGLPATSIAWGYWQHTTGSTRHLTDRDRARITATGLTPFAAEHGLTLFDRALATSHPVLAATGLDLRTLTRRARGGALASLLSTLVPHPVRDPDRGSDHDHPALAARLTGMTPDQRHHHLLDLVRSATAVVLGNPGPDTIDPHTTFKDLGIDSLTAVELRNTLTHTTGLALPPTLVFDHPTPAALTTHLIAQLVTPDHAEDDEEFALRQRLMTIPIAQLRRSGLLELLLRSAPDATAPAAEHTAPSPAAIETAAADELVHFVLGRRHG